MLYNKYVTIKMLCVRLPVCLSFGVSQRILMGKYLNRLLLQIRETHKDAVNRTKKRPQLSGVRRYKFFVLTPAARTP